VDEGDLLALELVEAAFLLPDILDQRVGLRPIGGGQGEDIGEYRAVTGVGAAVAHRDDRDLVGGSALDQRVSDSGRQRIDQACSSRWVVLEPLIALHT